MDYHRAISFLLFPFLCCIAQALVFNEAVHKVQVSAANCVLKLATQHFEPYSTIAFVRSRGQYKTNLSLAQSDEDLLLDRLANEGGNWSLVMKLLGEGGRKRHHFGFEKTHHYLISFQDIQDLQHVFNELSVQSSWNPHGQFLIYVGVFTNWQTFMVEVVQLLWTFWVVNAAIFFPVKDLNGHMVSYI